MTKKARILTARQGEILIFRLPPKSHHWLKSHRLVRFGNVIREGEKSGHRHEVKGQGDLLAPEGVPEEEKGMNLLLKVGKEGAEIRHPEHETIKLPEGEYHVLTQREFSEKQDRKAKD
jgi:hypothetical protein